MTPDRIGRYEIQRRLGTGGMGSLYLARDPGLDRLVAIKLLREDCREDPELRERFIREARSVARLRHPNIVVVHDVGEDDGRPFMAMEYIAGETLTRILRRTPSLPITERLGLIEALCAGLAHAHGAGIIHRDIKPANIMLDSDGVLKILDFGIARLGNSGITQDGMMMGTINYMSPEQVVGRGVDHRTDIFAAGAVLYETIALEQAFPGGVDSGVLHRILNEGPVPLEDRVPGLDPELARIARQALEREPTRRYQDANEMRLDVARTRRRLAEEAAGEVASQPATTVVDTRPKSSSAGRKIDSDRPARLSPERLAQLRRQQVEEHVRYSEEAFARGDHDAALHHAERAVTVDPDNRAAIDLIDRARFAIEAKAIRQLLGEAERLLSDGNFEDAAALADEASVTLPDIEGSAELRREVRQAVEKIGVVRDRERRITDALQRAKASIQQGGYETALRAVYEVLALDPERPEARELEHTAKERLHAQREHEQARRNAYDRLQRARGLADAARFEEALQHIHDVRPPSDTVRIAAEDALAAVRKLQRQAAHAAIVAEARAALKDGNLEDALAAIDRIPTGERSEEARSVHAAADEALRQRRERERKLQTFEAAIAGVHQLIDAGDLAKAFERVEEAARLGIEDERVPALRQRIADLGIAAQQKRQQEARDRLAAKRVEAARQLLADGNGYAAIALLERAGTDHPLIEEALREIRTAVAEQEERVRQEAERKRREEEARRRAELEEARRLEEQRRRQEEERRLREAELQRRRNAAAALLLKAEQALEADQPDEAGRSLDAVAAEIEALQDPALRNRAAAATAEVERGQKRRREIEQHASRARRLLSEGDLNEARQAARAALAMDAHNAAALKVLADADEEDRRREAEARRQEEARRREEEARRQKEEARRRDAAIADLLDRSRQLDSDEEALTILNEGMTLAPGDKRLQTQIVERKAALDRRKAAEEQRRIEERRLQEEARKREEEARREEERAAEEAARRERERERVRQEIQAHAARARELLGRGDLAGARQAADAGSALDANHPDVRAVLAAIRDEEKRRAEEARKREAEIAGLIHEAGQAPDHDAALTLLRQAETLVPGDPRLRTLIRERSAALDAQRAAERAAEEAARRERERLEQQARDEAAAAAISKARRIFNEGRHDDALALLRGAPAHASISGAITELDSRRAEIERERAREARRRRRDEQRIAAAAMVRRVVTDKRVHFAAAVIVLLSLGVATWQLWPTSEQVATLPPTNTEPETPPVSPTPGPPAEPVPPPVSPAPAPPTPAPTPPTVNPQPQPAAPGPPTPAPKPTPPAPKPNTPAPKPNTPAPKPNTPAPVQPSPVPVSPQPAPGPPPVTPSPTPAPTPAPAKPAPADPSPPPPAPPAVNLAAEEGAIRQLLAQWITAYNRMDEAGLTAIDPAFRGIPSRPLLRKVDLKVSPVEIDVTPDGQSAVLQATQNFTYEWNRAGFPRTTTGMLRWKLQKKGTTWVVVP